MEIQKAAITSKLQEMLLVIRPTKGDGNIPIAELATTLKALGYDFLIDKLEEIKQILDPQNYGYFYQNALVEYLFENHTQKFINPEELRRALSMFDFDNDGKIKYEEFEYFMSSFGDSEDTYMDQGKMQQLLECSKPLDDHGNIDIERFVQNVSSCWQVTGKQV